MAGIAALFMYRIARRMLDSDAPHLSVLLATTATALASLGTTWQLESTVAGGATTALALVMIGLDLGSRLSAPTTASLAPCSTKLWLQWALVCGLTFAESTTAGAALVLATTAGMVAAGKSPAGRLGRWVVGVAGGTGLWLYAPALIRPQASRNWNDLGHALSNTANLIPSLTVTPKATLLAWIDQVGVVALILASLGVFLASRRSGQRAWMSTLIVLPLLDLILPFTGLQPQLANSQNILRSLALVSFGIWASIGLFEVVSFLRRLDVPLARPAPVLAVIFHITMVCISCEEASFAADRSNHEAGDQWTELALNQLEPNAAILVHSPALTWRLWAAQSLRHMRPDVIIISAPLLRRGVVMPHLVPSEPNVGPLLRDFALNGTASEYGLSLLADARPLFVELDRSWNDRLLGHVTVDGVWLRYSAESLGKSDRNGFQKHVLTSNGRMFTQFQAGLLGRDLSSANILAQILKEHAAALSRLGLGEKAIALVDGAAQLTGEDPFVVGARLRLGHAMRRSQHRNPVELRDLLAF